MKQSTYQLLLRILISVVIACTLLSSVFLYQGYTERQRQAQIQASLDHIVNVIKKDIEPVKTVETEAAPPAPVEVENTPKDPTQPAGSAALSAQENTEKQLIGRATQIIVNREADNMAAALKNKDEQAKLGDAAHIAALQGAVNTYQSSINNLAREEQRLRAAAAQTSKDRADFAASTEAKIRALQSRLDNSTPRPPLSKRYTIVERDSHGRIKRSEAAKDDFKRMSPCPANGNTSGSCPGYVIDHITALACGGADDPSNMQWQTIAEGKAKDKWERKDCTASSSGSYSYSASSSYAGGRETPAASNSGYYVGKRGGCYKLTASGNKDYVDHSFCR